MTRGEKILLFLLILSLILLVLVLAYVAVLYITEEKICETPNCVKASAKLLENVDFSRNPCTEYEKFICNNNIPSSLAFIDNTNLTKLALISAPVQNSDSNDLVTVKRFYQLCTNASAIEADREDTMALIISRIGGWPILLGSKWNDSNFSWQVFMGEVRRWGIKNDWLISFDYYEDRDGINLLLIQPPNLKSISHEENLVYLDEIILKLSPKLAPYVVVSTTKIKELLDFEKGLVRITENARNELARGAKYKRITVGKLNQIWPNIDLVGLLNNLARGYSDFTNSTDLVVASENYLYQLQALLVRTSKRTQANYFIWKTVESFLQFFSSGIREIYAKYFALETRESCCFEETLKTFYSVIEMSHADKYRDDETIDALKIMANFIKRDTNVNIMGVDGPYTGFTDISSTSDNVIQMITDIQFKADNEFFKCVHQRASTCKRQSYYDPVHGFGQAKTSYDRKDDTIYLTYNLAYGDFFRWDQPNYINFARLGQAIGDALKEETYPPRIDNHGLDLAHAAYLQWVQAEGSEDKLPALKYTPNQLFWIHSSTQFCSLKNEEKGTKFDLVTKSPDFRQDFQCQ